MLKQEPHQVLRPLLRSPHWDLLEKVLKNRLEMVIQHLKTCEPEALGKLQGQVQELEDLLKMKVRLQTDEKARKGDPRQN